MMLTEPQIISVKEVHRNTQQLELNLDSNKENNFTEGKIDHINFQLASFLEKQGLEVIDKRGEGGSLWVIGNKEELTPIMTDLKEKGVRFLFSKTGSSVTKNRSAWYTSYKY